MPQGPATNPFMKPFVVLALPGMYLFYKYNQYRRRKKENAKRRLTERELQHLNNKIVSFFFQFLTCTLMNAVDERTTLIKTFCLLFRKEKKALFFCFF